ncbi:MAG: hypothetical protein IT458_06675 [Planctomycetes bacterium]|nr:hypothetical protein [Planctomycetota bacterium]
MNIDDHVGSGAGDGLAGTRVSVHAVLLMLLSCASSVQTPSWQELCDLAVADLSSGETVVRERAVHTLGALGASLVGKVCVAGPSVYAACAWPSGGDSQRVNLHEGGSQVVESIVRALLKGCDDAEWTVRVAALLAIEQCARDSEGVCDGLRAATRDPMTL